MELDYEQYKLVREALHERRIFLHTAPYLSSMLPIMLPIYKYVSYAIPKYLLIRYDIDIGKSLTTGPVARCTIYWPVKRTWRLPTL